ncbi:MAG: cytochrome c biogenesis protein CcsA [Thermoplasmata archaeon]
MHVGDVLLWVAFAVGILAVVLTVLKMLGILEIEAKVLWILAFLAFLFVSFSFFLLVYDFLSSDMTIEYVHSHSSTDYEWFYKLAGVWAGGKGSVFLWTFFLALFLFLQVSAWNLRSKKKRSSDRFQDWMFLMEAVILVLFVVIILRLEMFAPTSIASLISWPQGRGLNPLLVTPLMVVHPPIEFAAYAFCSIPFSAAIALLASDDERWTFDALLFGRISWLFMTLGIIIGALWAYIVLGWGGYWGWDPVETANLLPWISLTAFLHAVFWNRRKGSYRDLAPLLGILSFTLVLFTTFETRSGFVDSIHAFAGGSEGIPFDPADKLIFVLNASQESTFFISIMLFTLLIGMIFFLWRFLRTRRKGGRSRIVGYTYLVIFGLLLAPIAFRVTDTLSAFFEISRMIGLGNILLGIAVLLFLLIGGPFIWVVMTSETDAERNKEEKAPILSMDTWMIITVLILSVWFVATFLLMMQGINGLKPESFESRLPLLLIPLGAVLILCLSWGHVSPGFSFYVIGLIVATTVFGFVIFANRYFFVYIPVSLGILATAGYKIAKISSKKGTSKNLKLAGLLLIFSSILGMVMWGSGPSRIWFGPLSFHTSLPMLLMGFLASIVPFVAGISTLRGGDFRLALLGGVLGLASIGFMAGLVLSAIALALTLRNRNDFPESSSWRRTVRKPLVTAGAHLIHLGAALLIIGYAASTFLPMTYENEQLFTGWTLDTNEGYTFEIAGSSGVSSDTDPLYETVEVSLRISDPSGPIGSAVLRMTWSEFDVGTTGRYMSEVFVHSEHAIDIYFIVIGFFTIDDGWVFANAERNNFEKFISSSVSAIQISVELIPLTGLVWSGVWIMATGISARTVSDFYPVREKDVTIREKPPRTDEEYEEALKREIQMLEDAQ